MNPSPLTLVPRTVKVNLRGGAENLCRHNLPLWKMCAATTTPVQDKQFYRAVVSSNRVVSPRRVREGILSGACCFANRPFLVQIKMNSKNGSLRV